MSGHAATTSPFASPWPPAPEVIDYIIKNLNVAEGLGDAVQKREAAAKKAKRVYEKEGPTKNRAFAKLAKGDEEVTGIVDRAQKRACEMLKKELFDGTIGARGPISGPDDTEIDRSFWRFVELFPDGTAFNMSSMKKLPWVEINAEDVIRKWPETKNEAAAAAEPNAQAGETLTTRVRGKRRPRGPRAAQMPRVVAEMRASDQFHRLDDMTEVEMESLFKASRDTCRKARNRVILELSAPSTNSDK
jgi:hypothetical protein